MRRATAARVIVGMGLFAAGLVDLLNRLGGTAEAARLAERWWPALILLLVVVRACSFLGNPVPRATRPWMPLTLLAVGAAAAALLLLVTTGVLAATTLQNYVLPVALLSVGGLLTLAGRQPERERHTWIDEAAWLGRRRVASRARDVNSIAAQAVLGDVVLDLTRATLAHGGCELHATTWVGRIFLVCPAGWDVRERHRAGRSLDVQGTQQPPGLRAGHRVRLDLCLAGDHGSITVIWRDAPLTDPPNHRMTDQELTMGSTSELVEPEDGRT